MENEILKKLNGFPSCFHTFDFVQTFEKETKEKILRKVISEMDTDGYVSAVEGSRAYNFISYMSFAVGKFEDAVKYNSMALENNGLNINALVSKARYHLHNSEFADSRKQCDLLDNLKNNQLQMLYAKADQAYVCSRLGITMNKQAVNLFEEALKESEDIDACIPQYEICLLKFGLALSIKRQLNIYNIHSDNIDNFGQEAQRSNQLLELFMDIIKMQGENIDKHKAGAYVQTGETLNLLVTTSQTEVVSENILAALPGSNMKLKIKDCYEKAFSLQNKDVFVLERLAKYYRLIGQVDRSIELCRHALSIRETSSGHHYLALALKKRLQLDNTSHTKLTQRKYYTPPHVRALHTEMNAFPTNQDQQVTRRVHDSGISSMEPEGNSELACSAKRLSDEQTFSANDVKALSQLIKSPKKPPPLPRDQISVIILHLNRAMELAINTAALYDKGLTLRAVSLHGEALVIFKSMFRNRGCSLMQLANAYEQSALCLQDQIESDITTDCSEVEKMMIDQKEYLLKSIEITCNLISKQPVLKKCWVSFPTLKSLLEEHPKSKSNMRELGMLHRKVEDYNGAIGWFEKILNMETDDSNKARVHMDIVLDCLHAEKYAEAILHLDMVQCLRDCERIIDENLYFKAHIEGGFQSFLKGEKDMASLRLKNALNYKRGDEEKRQNRVGRPEQDALFQQEWFDVFILCDPKSATTGENMLLLLSTLGLSATLNDDCAAPELPSISGMTKVIERSTHCVVIIGNDMDNIKHIQLFTDIAKNVQESHNYGNIVVVMENENVQVDFMFTGFTSIIYEQVLTGSISEDHKPWLKKLLWILASGKERLE